MSKRKPREIFLRNPGRIYCFADSIALCRTLLEAGASVIQLRHKTADDSSFRRIAAEMLGLVRSFEDAVLIVNDRVDIALEIGADGIHVGQEDRDYREVVSRAPASMIIGVSARTPGLARAAADAGATYVGAGAVFATPTKPDAVVIGLPGLREVVAAVDIPVVAIGGIAAANLRAVLETGARYCAVISGINNASDPGAALRRLLAISASFPVREGR
jgi:thiamine-phosphate pyrophosphorylase